jgi:hypothetical protein
MMRFENPTTFVRAMKGAPISILVAFTFCRQAMSALELQEWTGYRGDAITPAVRFLVSTGWLIARSPRGPWCLAEGRQLPLMEVESVLNGYLPSSSSSSNIKLNVPSYHEEEEEEDESVLNGLIAALDAAGIREPKRSQLKKLKHVTVALINAHVRQCKAEGHPLGTAISRIEYNWAPLDRFMDEPDTGLDRYWSKFIDQRNAETDEDE